MGLFRRHTDHAPRPDQRLQERRTRVLAHTDRYYVQSHDQRLIEAWSSDRIPYEAKTSDQRRLRQVLQQGLDELCADTLASATIMCGLSHLRGGA